MKTKHSIHSFRNNYWRYITSFIIVFGIASLALAQIAPAKSAEPTDSGWTGRVVGITDGDTVTVLTAHNEQVKVRLYGIDCPEKKQAYGSKAKQFMSSLVFGCDVVVVPTGKDLYGRTIGKIFHEGRDIGLAMIASGHAWWYRQYAKKETDYKKAQEKAQKQQLGLWADPKPIEPSKFRKMKKEQ